MIYYSIPFSIFRLCLRLCDTGGSLFNVPLSVTGDGAGNRITNRVAFVIVSRLRTTSRLEILCLLLMGYFHESIISCVNTALKTSQQAILQIISIREHFTGEIFPQNKPRCKDVSVTKLSVFSRLLSKHQRGR